MTLVEKLASLKQNFEDGTSLDAAFRLQQLKNLQAALEKNEAEIFNALDKDLNKNAEEAWVTEIGFVRAEIKVAIKKLKRWMRPKRVSTNLVNLPGSSRINYEPLGVVLIISPWNYPVNLLFSPLIGAIAAGNMVVLKPSENAPACAAVMEKVIKESFAENYVLLVQGNGAEVIPEMMDSFTFQHVFYTGSTAVGKKIYEAAAKKLVPVTLELGGKSPCIVEDDANIDVAARRIVFTKFSNTGQTCVAPDYILVAASRRQQLSDALIKYIKQFYLQEPEYELGKIINEEQYKRLKTYLQKEKIRFGGEYNDETLRIKPTLLQDIDVKDKVMQEEIFGPILPIIAFNDLPEALKIIAHNPNPLAFYIFTASTSTAKKWIAAVPSGGAVLNNASVHLLNHKLPFGGRGASGIGHYHGHFSFLCFSHAKSVLRSATWFDPLLKYPPFKGKLKLLKKVVG